MRRFYALPESFTDQSVLLNQEETRHLRDVLRLRIGDEINIFDGIGGEFLCRIAKIEKKETVLQIIGKIPPAAPESSLKLTLAVALLKGDKFDFVVQKACELGVSQIIPLLTKRADIKLKSADEANKKIERWRKIALEAAKQCGRATLMQIELPNTFEDLRKRFSENICFFFSERNGESFEIAVKKFVKIPEILAIIGSEGGWDDSEIEAARQSNFQIITLGGRILRAETAAIAIPVLLQNQFGDFK